MLLSAFQKKKFNFNRINLNRSLVSLYPKHQMYIKVFKNNK